MQALLDEAMSAYNQGYIESHLRSLQDLMKVLYAPKKEIYIVKKDIDLYNMSRQGQRSTGRIGDILSTLMVDEPDTALLSEDPAYNSLIHSLKNQTTLLKLSIGRQDS